MTNGRSHTWQSIQSRIRRNITDGTWAPGQLIPAETDLAVQFGCARSTVNRALRELALTGVVDRKRKAGTRVAMQRARKVTAEIAVIRSQVEAKGQAYRFTLLANKTEAPPAVVREAMKLARVKQLLHVRSVHYADDAPYIYEDRWINTRVIPDIKNIDLQHNSVNEWLVQNIPFTRGEFVVQAVAANRSVARALGLKPGDAILKTRRITWLDAQSVTLVSLYYATGHQLCFEI